MDEYRIHNENYLDPAWRSILIGLFFNVKISKCDYLLIEIDDDINSEYITEILSSSKSWVFHLLIPKTENNNKKNYLIIIFYKEMDFSKLFKYLKVFYIFFDIDTILSKLAFNIPFEKSNFCNFSCIYSEMGRWILSGFITSVCGGFTAIIPPHWDYSRYFLLDPDYYLQETFFIDYDEYFTRCSYKFGLDSDNLQLLFIKKFF